MIYNHLPTSQPIIMNKLSKIHGLAHQQVVLDQPKTKTSNRVSSLTESLSHLLHLHLETPPRTNTHQINWNLYGEEKLSTPTTSP